MHVAHGLFHHGVGCGNRFSCGAVKNGANADALLSTTFQLPLALSSVKSITPRWSPQRPGMTAEHH
jgi:hypothetical protein